MDYAFPRLPKGGRAIQIFRSVHIWKYRLKQAAQGIKMEVPVPDNWSTLDLPFKKLFDAFGDELEPLLACNRPLWIGGKTEIVPMQIYWGQSDASLVQAFGEWLKQRRPKGEEWDERPPVEEPPKQTSGAGSPIRQIKFKLQALGAWRIFQHYSGNYLRCIGHPYEGVLGKQFDSKSAWAKAKSAALKVLQAEFPSNDFG